MRNLFYVIVYFSEESTANTGKQISCPNCAHCFDITDGEQTKKGTKRKSTSSTSRTNSKV